MALSDNLIAYWPLDEASGVRADAHGTNDLADNGTVAQGAAIVQGNSADFTPNQFLSIASNADLSTGDIDFTFAGWVVFDSFTGAPAILGKDNGGAGEREYGLYGYTSGTNRLRWVVSSNGTGEQGAVEITGLTTATPYFVVCGHDSVNDVTFMSVNDGAMTTTAWSGGVRAGTGQFRLGDVPLTSLYMNGRLDEWGFWKRVLTSAEITELFNAGAGRTYSYIVGGANSFLVSPATLPANHDGNITLSLTGTDTTWSEGVTVFTVSGVTGWAKVSQVVNSATSATIVVSCPAAVTPPNGDIGDLTISDGTSDDVVEIVTPTLTVTPLNVATGTTPTVTLAGVGTIWTLDSAVGLFSVTGGTGASIADPIVTTNNAATAILTVGTSAGTLTIRDDSTGATDTVEAAILSVIVFLGDSMTFGTGASSGQGTTDGTCYPAITMNGLGRDEWQGHNEGVGGEQIPAIEARISTDVEPHLSSTATRNVVILWAGVNDIANSVAAATVWARLQSCVAALKALTPQPEVYLLTHVSGQPIFGPDPYDTVRNTVNGLIQDEWFTIDLDGIIHIGFDARLGRDGAYTDVDYFNDVVHLNDGGYRVVGEYVSAAVLRGPYLSVDVIGEITAAVWTRNDRTLTA